MTSILWTQPCFAQNIETMDGEAIARAVAATPVADQTVRKSAKGISRAPNTPPGLYAYPISTNLDDIAAITADEDGTLYTLDTALGRVFALPDRGGDGRIDGRRLFANGFDRPSGMTYMDGKVYVADSHAIWAVDIDSRKKRKIASLSASGADTTPRPLAGSNGQIIAALSFTKDVNKVRARIVAIDRVTGSAVLLKDMNAAPISALAVQKSGQIWAAASGQLVPIIKGDIAFPILAGAPITGLAFGAKGALPSDWPDTLKHSIYLSTGKASGNSGSFSVLTLNSEFGAPAASVNVMVNGFYSERANSIWGRPAALLPTRRGLVIADRFGSLWRVSVDSRPAKRPRDTISHPLPELPVQKPSHERGELKPMAGSLITGSGISQGSTITTGSVLIEKFNAEEAAKAEAEKALSQNARAEKPK